MPLVVAVNEAPEETFWPEVDNPPLEITQRMCPDGRVALVRFNVAASATTGFDVGPSNSNPDKNIEKITEKTIEFDFESNNIGKKMGLKSKLSLGEKI